MKALNMIKRNSLKSISSQILNPSSSLTLCNQLTLNKEMELRVFKGQHRKSKLLKIATVRDPTGAEK